MSDDEDCPHCGSPRCVGDCDGDEMSDYRLGNYDEELGCCLGNECLMPSYDHRAGECYNVEMAEAWADEAAQNSYQIFGEQP